MEDNDGDSSGATPDLGLPQTPGTSGGFDSSSRDPAPWALEQPLAQATTPSDHTGASLYGTVCLELEQAMEQHQAASSGGSNDGQTVGGAAPAANGARTIGGWHTADGTGAAPAAQLFFARVPRTIAEHEVVALFSRYGQVRSVTVFRAFHRAPVSKASGDHSLADHKRVPRRRAAPSLPWTEPGSRHARPGRGSALALALAQARRRLVLPHRERDG
jgi:hypothetical protein